MRGLLWVVGLAFLGIPGAYGDDGGGDYDELPPLAVEFPALYSPLFDLELPEAPPVQAEVVAPEPVCVPADHELPMGFQVAHWRPRTE